MKDRLPAPDATGPTWTSLSCDALEHACELGERRIEICSRKPGGCRSREKNQIAITGETGMRHGAIDWIDPGTMQCSLERDSRRKAIRRDREMIARS